MRDSVLVVEGRRAFESELRVEPLEIRLRTDSNRHVFANGGNPASHEFAAKTTSSYFGCSDHPSETHLRELHSRRKNPQIGDDRAVGLLSPEMATRRVAAIRILVGAALLDHEDLRAQRHDRIELTHTQRIKRPFVPDEITLSARRRPRPINVRFGARITHFRFGSPRGDSQDPALGSDARQPQRS